MESSQAPQSLVRDSKKLSPDTFGPFYPTRLRSLAGTTEHRPSDVNVELWDGGYRERAALR